MSSPECARQMELLWLQGSRVIELLTEMSRNAVNAEGWVRLDVAGQALWANAEEDMSSLQTMYGYNQLKPLVVASQVLKFAMNAFRTGVARPSSGSSEMRSRVLKINCNLTPNYPDKLVRLHAVGGLAMGADDVEWFARASEFEVGAPECKTKVTA